MNFINFFTQVANSLLNHYQQLTDSVRSSCSPDCNTTSTDLTEQPQQASIPTDSYVPSTDSSSETDNTAPTTEDSNSDSPTYTNPTEPNKDALPADTETGDVAYFIRKAKLDYKMALQFDLAAVQSVAEHIADGDTDQLSEFAAAGFGLHAAIDIKGMEIMKTNMTDGTDGNRNIQFHSKDRSKLAAKFAAQSKNFDLESFYRESTDVSRMMNVETFHGYRRAINKFALRYRLDSRFSFGFAQRFNVQTKQVAKTDPANLNNYVTTAGNVAEKGTAEMMQTFFDTVDQYLSASEKDLLAKADEFYAMAVEQLGFSEETASMVKDKIVDSIESFFGRVNDSVDLLQSKFVSPEIAQPDVSGEVTDIPDVQNQPETQTPTKEKTETALV